MYTDGRKIRRIRKEKGLKLRELAEILEINYESMARIERNSRRKVKVALVNQIAYTLGCNISDICASDGILICKKHEKNKLSDREIQFLFAATRYINQKIDLSNK